MADKVIPTSGGEIVVSKGAGGWPVELEVRSGTSVPETVIYASLTRRDAAALRIAIAELLSDDALAARGRGDRG